MTNDKKDADVRRPVKRRAAADRPKPSRPAESRGREDKGRDSRGRDSRSRDKDRDGKGRSNRSRDSQGRDDRGRTSARPRPTGAPKTDRRYASSAKTWRADEGKRAAPPPAVADLDKQLEQAARSSVGPAGYRKFSDIPAHKLGRVIRGDLYSVAKQLGSEEADNLILRIKKEATTITAALVTGFGEGTFRSGVTGALKSRGAALVLQDHLDQAEQLSMISSEARESLREQLDGVIAALNEYMGELVRQRDSGSAAKGS